MKRIVICLLTVLLANVSDAQDAPEKTGSQSHKDSILPVTSPVIVAVPTETFIFEYTKPNLLFNPVNSSQEMLRLVPGLVTGQHSGRGKVEQMFLRGIDLDHGTDLNITVDNMPVNMVSHTHGQGYADLRFVIPETVKLVKHGKGFYYADQGNFGTAGFARLETHERIEHSFLKTELAQFNGQRVMGLLSLANKSERAAYVASEFVLSDGPFDSPQNFSRINLMGKYTEYFNKFDKLSVSTSFFTSNWDASGLIPTRAVESGTIGRFGFIDDAQGGQTQRTNLAISYDKRVNDKSLVRNTLYLSQYDFELYSNDTYFLNDSSRGDQLGQREKRRTIGVISAYDRWFNGKVSGVFTFGKGFRNDQISESELIHTRSRQTTFDTLQRGRINETNLYAYLDMKLFYGKWLINPGVRGDWFMFKYNDQLSQNYETQAVSSGIISPKMNIIYLLSTNLRFYFKTGMGFHSNDSRAIIARNGEDVLPLTYGGDLGLRWQISPDLKMDIAYWYMEMEREYVYDHSSALLNQIGRSRRTGVDLHFSYSPLSWLSIYSNGNYVFSRDLDARAGSDFIPLAPDLSIAGGLSVDLKNGFYGSIKLRHIGDRPANIDNSLIARGYTVTDFGCGYRWQNINLSVTVQNLLDTEWEETQFAWESKLQNEAQATEDIHFTPGTPFFIRAAIRIDF